jgi:polysaccharide biosynthesis transport protein
MTNEMQLAHAADSPFGGTDFGNEMGGNQQSKPMGLKKIHRLLRGRYPLVITMGLLFGLAGALTGYLIQRPLFNGQFQVDISSTVPNLSSPVGDPIPDYDRLLQTQVAMIKNPELIQRAMEEDEWKSVGGAAPQDESSVTRFAQNVVAQNYPMDTSMVMITFSDPDRNIAIAGAKSILKAYTEFFNQMDPMMYSGKLQELDNDRTRYQDQINTCQQRLREIQSLLDTDDLTTFQSQNMAELGKLGNDLDEAKMQLEIDQGSLNAIQQGGSDGNDNPTTRTSPLTQDQIEAIDNGVLKQMLGERNEIASRMQEMKLDGYGDENPLIKQFRNVLAVRDKAIEDYIETYSQGGYRMGIAPDGRPGLTSLSQEIITLKMRIGILQTQFDQQKAKCDSVGKYSQMISDLKNTMKTAQDNLERTNADYERLVGVQSLNEKNQMRVIVSPFAPNEPSVDRRRMFTILGFFGGALLPTLVVLLLSLLDGRFRYSDEANSDMTGIPLLGILPNLPDLLTDPAQAATAAHCVHQIRTILQITGHSTERRVFAITSASPGDGKTSLTLALGLSFAASGSRTLLIDGDLIGGGLTARLNVNAEHGLLEAMASRDIAPFIRTTDVADLSFLPVGRAMGGYTGTVSPAAVRRLVDEARKQFDVVLIDTGPILGSIEASPVAVASDGVVLCVSRGQQRQLVDRALEHLHAIGGKLAGVVFNRAQAHDFERSTNRLGLSSVPAGADGRRSEAIGPVARAVASSVRSSSGSEH